MTSKYGFSVVAPISVTRPSSTAGSRASCWALLKRWISSRKNIVGGPLPRRRSSARSITARTSALPAFTADSSSNAASAGPAMIRASVVLPGARAGRRGSPSGARRTRPRCEAPTPRASRCSWPTSSSRVRGRMRTASGASGRRLGAVPLVAAVEQALHAGEYRLACRVRGSLGSSSWSASGRSWSRSIGGLVGPRARQPATAGGGPFSTSPAAGAGANVAISGAAAVASAWAHARAGRVSWRLFAWMAPTVARRRRRRRPDRRRASGRRAARSRSAWWCSTGPGRSRAIAAPEAPPPETGRADIAERAGVGFGVGLLGGFVGLILGSMRLPAMIKYVGMSPSPPSARTPRWA